MTSAARPRQGRADRALLLLGGTVVTMDPDRRIIPDGAVLVRSSDIAEVGTAEELEARHSDAERIEVGRDDVVLPGLINTHTHLFQTLLKGLGDDRPLNRWLIEMTAPAGAQLNAEDCEAAATHGAVEAIRSGCTTIVDFMYAHPRPGLTDAVIAGLREAGVRALVARGFVTRGTELGVPPELVEPVGRVFADCERLVAAHADDPLIRIGLAPCLLWMVSEEDLRASRAFADAHRVTMTYHMAETSFETTYAEKTYGVSEPEFLERIGFLGPDLLAVHCTKLSAAGIEILARARVAVSHNPISNMYLAAGIAPIPRMLARGMTVGLATDGPASNNNQNMVHVLKATALLHKVATEDPEAITAPKVLELATIEAARAIGMGNQIGSIEPGKRADLAIFSLANVFAAPVHDPVSALVYAAAGGEAVTTIVNGRPLMRNRRVLSVDEDSMMERSRRAAHSLARRAGIAVSSSTRLSGLSGN